MTLKDVLQEYNKCKSIRGTAAKLSISQSTVRKVLVTYGVIDTPVTRRIEELRKIGLNQNQIADMMGVSKSCVNVNTPYERGTYLTPSMTVNAIRIRRHREKQAENK